MGRPTAVVEVGVGAGMFTRNLALSSHCAHLAFVSKFIAICRFKRKRCCIMESVPQHCSTCYRRICRVGLVPNLFMCPVLNIFLTFLDGVKHVSSSKYVSRNLSKPMMHNYRFTFRGTDATCTGRSRYECSAERPTE